MHCTIPRNNFFCKVLSKEYPSKLFSSNLEYIEDLQEKISIEEIIISNTGTEKGSPTIRALPFGSGKRKDSSFDDSIDELKLGKKIDESRE